jgi:hypothetical protein
VAVQSVKSTIPKLGIGWTAAALAAAATIHSAWAPASTPPVGVFIIKTGIALFCVKLGKPTMALGVARLRFHGL